jgi:hypothetical protein
LFRGAVLWFRLLDHSRAQYAWRGDLFNPSQGRSFLGKGLLRPSGSEAVCRTHFRCEAPRFSLNIINVERIPTAQHVLVFFAAARLSQPLACLHARLSDRELSAVAVGDLSGGEDLSGRRLTRLGL